MAKNSHLFFITGRKSSRGDTIVEVLIAIAIISLVLASAFTITRRNTAATQDVEEHAFAQKLVETQTEQLRDYALAEPGGEWCFDTSSDPQDATSEVCNISNGGAEYSMKIHKISGSKYSISAEWNTATGARAIETVYYIK